MRRIIFFISPMLFVLLLSVRANATAILSQFAIRSEHLNEGKILALGGAAVSLTADVMFTKAGESNNTVVASMVYAEAGQPDLVLASSTRYEGDWINSNSITWQFSLAGTLPQNRTLGKVLLRYQLFQGSASAGIFSSISEYQITTVVIPPSNPNTRPVVPNTPYNKRFLVPADVPVSRSFSNESGTVTVVSNGNLRLDFQTDGNLVLYNGSAALWASRVTSGGVSKLFVDSWGNLRIWNSSQGDIWNANIPIHYLSIWVLQDDGNFVGYSSYSVDPQGNVSVYGPTIGATMTQGGKKSDRSGRLN